MKLPPRPIQLKLGVGVLALEMIASFSLTLAHVWHLKQAYPAENYMQVLVGTFGLPLVEAPLLWLLARGVNWARYVAALLLVAGLVDYAVNRSLFQLSSASPFELIRDWGSYGLMLLGVAILFTPQVSKWFRQVGTAL
jgi:hypothetical protein